MIPPPNPLIVAVPDVYVVLLTTSDGPGPPPPPPPAAADRPIVEPVVPIVMFARADSIDVCGTENPTD